MNGLDNYLNTTEIVITTALVLLLSFSFIDKNSLQQSMAQTTEATPPGDMTQKGNSNNESSLKPFDVLSPVNQEMHNAESSGILYQDFVYALIHNAKEHPDNNTLQREYKLIQNNIKFEYGDFQILCNIGDTKGFDTKMRDACDMKIAFIYPACQADPLIHKEACNPSNQYINNYLKHFDPSIQKYSASKLGYVDLNSAFTSPPPT